EGRLVDLAPYALGQLLGPRIVAVEDEIRVEVAVARVTERRDPHAVAGADLVDRDEPPGHARPGHPAVLHGGRPAGLRRAKGAPPTPWRAQISSIATSSSGTRARGTPTSSMRTVPRRSSARSASRRAWRSQSASWASAARTTEVAPAARQAASAASSSVAAAG